MKVENKTGLVVSGKVRKVENKTGFVVSVLEKEGMGR